MPAGEADDSSADRRLTRLAPELSSARVARRLLRRTLSDAGVAGSASWGDDAELAVHEVVANAVLHAHTSIEVTIEPGRDRVRVEVRDYEPTLPTPRAYDPRETTGRGMSLVAALTDRCGARSLGPDGKIVWFEVSADNGGHHAGWDVEDVGSRAPAPQGPAVRIRLQAMPVRLWQAARQHHDALLRELMLFASERESLGIDLTLAGRARETVSQVVDQTADRLGPALMRSWEPVAADVEVLVPRDAGPAYVTLREMLGLAERLAGSGELLTRPGLPEIVAVRDWVYDEIAAQLAGREPEPWPGTARALFETAVNPLPGRGTLPADVLGISGSTRQVVAVDASNRIIAVSRPLAEQLDWRVDELLGRRLVSIIPAELREAHVAGFSRYLSSGETSLGGAAVEMPVQRRDGTTLRCMLTLEETPGAGGEAIVVGWMSPVPSGTDASGAQARP
ncbi:MAG: putative sensor protein [Nocardioidaceae bacterium]|nr:putative sensor protein [Nocardioidaceae bacterium]